jgi:[ribosomal protein S18]-alanine N-acetyltransferase
MNIRRANAADIPALLELERRSETAGHWAEEQYRQIFQAGDNHASQRLTLVVDEVPAGSTLPSVLGFVVARHVGAEWELENIVVAEAERGKGLGGRLLGEFLRQAHETNSESVFLEVRESNQAARGLYEKSGFQQTGRRKGYYSKPCEDAVLYRLGLAHRDS